MDQNDQQIDTEALDATQNLIQRLSGQLEELMRKQKEVNEMLKGVFENDEELQKAEMVADEAKKTATSRKKDLNGNQEVQDLKMKLTDVKEDIKMVKESLNTHLLNYFQMTNSRVIDFADGDEREIDIKASLKGKKR